MTEAMLLETEAAVLANFEFLAQADVEMSDDDDMADDLDLVPNEDESDVKTTKRRAKPMAINDGKVFNRFHRFHIFFKISNQLFR